MSSASTPTPANHLPALFSTFDFLEWPDRKSKSSEANKRRQAKRALALYDVKFYPFPTPGDLPVFAVTGDVHTIVCRVSRDKIKGAEVLLWLQDEDKSASLNSLCWTYDPVSGHPLLVVAGQRAVIKMFDVTDGKLVRSLAGHGGPIQDLAISPKDPQLLASSSDDHTIRIWHLGQQYSKQPLAALLHSIEGHKLAPLSIAFHATGDWLLSGGMDTAVCLVGF